MRHQPFTSDGWIGFESRRLHDRSLLRRELSARPVTEPSLFASRVAALAAWAQAQGSTPAASTINSFVFSRLKSDSRRLRYFSSESTVPVSSSASSTKGGQVPVAEDDDRAPTSHGLAGLDQLLACRVERFRNARSRRQVAVEGVEDLCRLVVA